ncbi:nuclear pore complex protein Nup88 isoform X1 [Leptopilina boulardi]|uniref:nuclear pore complex protein Nup88 isoform X1 n=1 Tax=Leptopilina boulardi TaxID=63433 RepID=UPI0021F5558D|nr:nuclear pore complex protein Nup88 isoform X1 [Leptopilina boulardi]
MSSCTDLLHLNDKRLFQELKKSLPKGAKETRNIIEIRDDILYVWNADTCCILTLDIAATREKLHEDVPYQSLHLTDPPIFEVTHLVINELVTQLILWGNLGIVVVELPKRWGKESAFKGGRNSISCISHHLDGFGFHLATNEIRKAKWHPGSINHSHLVVLTSQNTFHLYECLIGETPTLLKTWKVGPTPSTSPSKIPSFASLGEIAVDFDFSSPCVQTESDKDIEIDKMKWNQIEWPILVLRGNGDVFILKGDILTPRSSAPIVLGSLSMYPPAVDNYGIDCCSIMCIQTTPPIVVIADCSGKIYHAILLPDDFEDEEKKTWSQYGSTYSLHTPDVALYVYECVEMELGLFYNDDDKKYTCPVYLHKDKDNSSRYFCSHNAGIHVVNLPMVSQLEEYRDAGEENLDLFLPSLKNQSNSQYLVCTRTKHTVFDDATPILGLGLLREPCVLISLLYTGFVVNLSIADFNYLPKFEYNRPINSSSKKVTKEPFDAYIKQFLRHESSQPITMLGLRQNLTARDSLELLYRATTIFRSQHFLRHDKVREEILKKVRTLKALKNHQLKELEYLIHVKKELQETAEKLAERYEDIKDNQEDLARRAQEVLRLVNLKEPSLSPIERAEAEEMKLIENKVKEFSVRLEQLKKKANKQTINIVESPNTNGKKKEIVFKEKQVETIKSNLLQMGKDIADLVSRTKTLEEEVL